VVLRQADVVSGQRILVIDSYDSFVYNLVQYLGELGADPIVVRNDQITVDDALALEPDALLLSPGPGRPEDAGIICAAVPAFAERGIHVLGVCLGLQVIAHVYGGSIVRAPSLMHGKTSEIRHDSRTIFRGMSAGFKATRYHSLMVKKEGLPDWLEISATSHDGLIMALRHKKFPVEGVQFHPESIMTENGKMLLDNFLKL